MSVETVFYHLLNMSLAASLLAIPVLVLRRFRSMPRRWLLPAWLAVALRLAIPAYPSSPLSLLGLAGTLVRRLVPVGTVVMDASFANAVGTASSYAPVRQATGAAAMFFGIASVVWVILAVLGLVLLLVVRHLDDHRISSQAYLLHDRWVSAGLQTPVVQGLFRQRILLPPSLGPDDWELAYVDLHERVHMRRHDNLLRLVAILIAVLHWFNPLVWVYLGLFLRDLEQACDEAAVAGLPDAERTRYAKALVNLGAGRTVYPDPMGLGTAGIAFGEGKLGVRVRAVLSGKPLRGPLAVLAILLLVLLGVAMLTNPTYNGWMSGSGTGGMPADTITVPAGSLQNQDGTGSAPQDVPSSAVAPASADRAGALPAVRVMEMISSTMPAYIHPKDGIGEEAARARCAEWISGWMEKGGASNPNLDGLALREHTLREGWDNGRLQLFGVSGFATNDGYAIFQDGKLLTILPGMGVMSAWLSDQDADGQYEFYINAAFGSGIVNEEIHCFDPRTGETWHITERGKRDFILFLRDGRLVVRVIPYSSPRADPYRMNEFRELVLTGEGLALGQEVAAP